VKISKNQKNLPIIFEMAK